MIRLHRPECPNPDALSRGNYKHSVNKNALIAANYEKCMYCESKVTHIDFGDVEHIKPKGDRRFSHLANDWSNLGYVCGKCNNAKGAKYFDDVPFIDPYSEDPADHFFALGWMLRHRNGSERGEVTVKEIDLNRSSLLEKRMHRLNDIHRALDAAHRSASPTVRLAVLDEIRKEAEADKEYSFFVRALLDAHAG